MAMARWREASCQACFPMLPNGEVREHDPAVVPFSCSAPSTWSALLQCMAFGTNDLQSRADMAICLSLRHAKSWLMDPVLKRGPKSMQMNIWVCAAGSGNLGGSRWPQSRRAWSGPSPEPHFGPGHTPLG